MDKLDLVKQKVAELLDSDNSGHGMDHIQRVLEISLKIAETETADTETVALIALLHDADDHKLFGEENAKNLTNTKRILKECEIDEEKQKNVILSIEHIGYTKRLKGKSPSSIEGKIVSDADMCDAIGITGIIRTAQYSWKHNSPFFKKDAFPIEDLTSEKYNRKSADSAVCHFFEKLLKLKNLMLTNSGKKEALLRHQRMVDFLYSYFDEQNVPEWSEYLTNYLNNNQ